MSTAARGDESFLGRIDVGKLGSAAVGRALDGAIDFQQHSNVPSLSIQQAGAAGSDQSATDPNHAATHNGHTSSVADSLLLLHADALNGIEAVRVATENRLRALVDAKGIDGVPEVAAARDFVGELKALEGAAALRLKRTLRIHPLGGWVKSRIGVGERQGARLIAAIGDPLWNHAVDRPRRGPAELWAYCGYHVLHPDAQGLLATQHTNGVGAEQVSDTPQAASEAQRSSGGVAPSRRRGQKANWNPDAKMRAYLIAEQCTKYTGAPDKNGRVTARSPFRDVYDSGRIHYANSIHHHPCPRCGPSGKPAPVGSPLSAGHQHARAMRQVAKKILLDLYLYARDEAARP